MKNMINMVFVLLIINTFRENHENINNNNILELKENEKSDDIFILSTNDVPWGINDEIGYDGLMLYKK